MNKKYIFIFVLFCILFVCGCQSNETPPEPNPYDIYKSEIISQMEAEKEDGAICKKVGFMSESGYVFADETYGEIIWSSSDTSYITETGRYKVNTLGKNITLHADVTLINGDKFDFDYDVYVKGFISEEEYLEEIYKLIPDNIVTDIVFPTEESYVLRSRGISTVVRVESLNEDIISSKGKYKLDSDTDTNVRFKVTVSCDEFTITGECVKNVLGRHDKEYVEHAIDWLAKNFEANMNATGDLDLPMTDDKGFVTFEYKSSNPKVFNNYGEMVRFIANTEVEFIVSCKMNDYVQTATVKAKTLDRSQMLEYIADRMHVEEYQQRYLITYIVSTGTKFDDFGYLNFYVKDISESDILLSGIEEKDYKYGTLEYNTNVSNKPIEYGIVPMTTNHRPAITKTSTEFICIHDTGDNYYDAAGWAHQIMTDNREVSWHFTADDHDIYQHLPINEVAWHAGDGSRTYKLLDTGVKYAGRNPELEFRKDNYLYINGVKSTLKAPLDSDGNYQYAITPAGLYTEMGDNGNYMINNYYFSGGGYNKISNCGGNRNSVGIETCVTDYTRYSETMRSVANLVAHLLNIYDLDLSRVLQHRNFSGKLCPQTMIRQNTYDEWKEVLWCEYYILNNLHTAKFTYKSNNPDIVGDDGMIKKYVTEDTLVSYTVKIEFEDLKFEKTYETIIKPIKA